MPKSATAVLVIDMQVGVLETCFDAAGVTQRVAALVERARSAGVPVIWVQHADADLPPGSPVWQLAPGLAPRPDEPVVGKSFSDAFAGTTLRAELDVRGVGRLVCAGAQSDYCVGATLQRAAVEGYAIALVADAHTTEDACFAGVTIGAQQIIAHTHRTLGSLRRPGVEVELAMHDTVALMPD